MGISIKMRLLLSTCLLSLALLKPIYALPREHAGDQGTVSIQTASPQKPAVADEDDGGPKYTRFNGIEVPPMKELSGENFDKEIKDGYWYRKAPLHYCDDLDALSKLF